MRMHFPEAMIVAKADRDACRALIRTGSKTFFAASHLLPSRVREPAIALYAFCRLADDAVDLPEHQMEGRIATLARLRDRLDRAYCGQPLALPADRAFADTVRRFGIPRALPEALLEGLEWDADGRRYETFADLRAYAARVAGSVGAMMAVIMGVDDPAAIARACDLGAAMQLTNIARDIGEDARNGRLYLPLAWLREAGLDPDAWLAAPRFDSAIGMLTRRLLAEADALYAASEAGITALPRACRPGIRAAGLLYREIGGAIARGGYDSVGARAFVPGYRKAMLMLKALAQGHAAPLEQRRLSLTCFKPRKQIKNNDLLSQSDPGSRSDAQRGPTFAEARFLVEAVEARGRITRAPRRSAAGQVVWVFELFARIDSRREVQSGL